MAPKATAAAKKSVKSLKKRRKTTKIEMPTIKCEHCKKRFTQVGSLERHIQTVHEKLKLFECMFCEKTFGYKVYRVSIIRIFIRIFFGENSNNNFLPNKPFRPFFQKI
jgi:hypothetical protein